MPVQYGPNAKDTQRLLGEIDRHPVEILEGVDEMMASGDMHWSNIDLTECLRKDLGSDYRHTVQSMSMSALEATVTSGTFVKFAERMIRFGLRETPKEQYLLLNRVTIDPDKGECERPYRDRGIFSDPEVAEVRELQAPPSFGVSSEYMDHPTGRQVGLGFEFTREAMCGDPNGFLMQQVPKIADAHNQNIENTLLDLFIGYTSTYNRSGTDYATYYGPDAAVTTPFGDGSGGPWVNAMANDLNCPEDFQSIKDQLYDYRDLVHGRPVVVPTDGLTVLTSRQKADRIRPKLAASAIETDGTSCDGGTTTHKYIMTSAVANGMEVDLLSYQRLVDRIVLRYGVSASAAQNWIWVGDISAFLSWVFMIRPEVSRVPIAGELFEKRVVAKWTSLSKGYGYIRDPFRGFICVPTT